MLFCMIEGNYSLENEGKIADHLHTSKVMSIKLYNFHLILKGNASLIYFLLIKNRYDTYSLFYSVFVFRL